MAAAAQPGSDDDKLGPVDFLAIEFPGGRLTAPGFEELLSLADQGVVDILDMEFIAKDADGKGKKVDVWEFAVPDGVDLTAWAGASSGLLDDSDVGEISAAMQPGSVAVVVIYENRWVLGLVDAWRRDGAQLIANGGISASDIVAALDASEPS
jgi:Family of unknown function (DUF6325)